MTTKHAIIIGATGLVGSHLLEQIIEDERFSGVDVFGRRSSNASHPKINEQIIDFEKPADWQHKLQGDVVYLCLGTTRAKAGGKKAQYVVDYTYQYEFAKAAAAAGVNMLVLVSSAGARLSSRFFYIRMKAELERDIRGLSFGQMVFIRPGSLTGPRREKRLAENFGVWVMRQLNRLGIARKYKPIHANTVAKAMINATFKSQQGVSIHELDEVFALAGER